MAVWGQTLRFGFVWDDTYFIVRNTALRDWRQAPAYFYDRDTSAGANRADEFLVFRPLRNLSYAADYSVAGLDPRWWHAHHVMLHLVNALLVGWIAGRLSRSWIARLVASLLFLVHPALTEAVAWVKCRDDLLAAFWTLLAFGAWLRWRAEPWTWRRITALAGAYGLACLAKDQAIILPLLFAAGGAWLPGAAHIAAPASPRTRVALWTSLAAVGVGYLAWRHGFMGRTSQTDYLAGFLPTMLTMVRVALLYLHLLVVPHPLLADYSGMLPSQSPLDPRVVSSAITLILVATLVWRARVRQPVITFGILWIAIALLPVSNLVPMMQYLAERFLYLPLIGLAWAAGDLAARQAERRGPVVLLASAAVLVAAALLAHQRAAVWRDDLPLFEATVRDTPDHALRPRRNLLAALLSRGHVAQARPLAEQLWARAQHDSTLSPRARAEYAHHLALIDLRTGQPDAGRALMSRAIDLDPTYAEPYLALGIDAGSRGDAAAALSWFDRAAAASPDLAAAHANRGVALRELGRVDDAEQAFRQAVRLAPDDPMAYKSLAALLWSRGQIAQTIPLYAEAARLWPDDPDIRHWLAEARQAAP